MQSILHYAILVIHLLAQPAKEVTEIQQIVVIVNLLIMIKVELVLVKNTIILIIHILLLIFILFFLELVCSLDYPLCNSCDNTSCLACSGSNRNKDNLCNCNDTYFDKGGVCTCKFKNIYIYN